MMSNQAGECPNCWCYRWQGRPPDALGAAQQSWTSFGRMPRPYNTTMMDTPPFWPTLPFFKMVL
jgi:hypothetical protein